MSWPLSQDYNEAIQSPASNFADPDLRRGEAAANALGIPMPYSGNFADVYQVRCPNGSRWAVKCFTRQAEGLRERYQEISKHLRQAKLPFTVDFTYLEQGIRVLGRWYPVLKMQWVEGLTLNQFVKQHLDRPATLEALLLVWARMAKALRVAQIGHCDLQHGNILLVPDGGGSSLALKLIDYDGMWVPALAGRKSGEVGHASYQHPQRITEGTYSIDVDRFPQLLIATALRALKVSGRALWDRYDNGDNILFRESDLRDPRQSRLIQELLNLGDPATAALLAPLLKSLWGGLASAPLLEEVMPETRLAPPPTAVSPRAAAPIPVASLRVAAPTATAAPRQDPWDFDESAPPVSAPSTPRAMRTRRRGRGVPVWAWTAAVTLLIVALGVAAAAVLANQSRLDNPPDGPPVVQTKPANDKGSGKPIPPKPGDSSITNSIGMKLVLIPAGWFLMGSPANEQGRSADEGPQHEVEITQPFYLGVYPVMKGQFAEFRKDGGYQTEAEKGGEKATWRNPGFDQTDNDPVVEVSWNDAGKFCEWLSRKDGRTYELPTEAEWEYACRAGTTTPFSCGATISTDQANYNGNSIYDNGKKGLYRQKTTPVGSFPPNTWGLYDMHGNVWQWCADCYDTDYYRKSPIKDPKDDNSGGSRVLRGGSWYYDPGHCRSATRNYIGPGDRNKSVGFRVVLRSPARTP